MDEINLRNCLVSHKTFGNGKVVEMTEKMVKVLFKVGKKQFQYPQAFEKFLVCEDDTIQDRLQDLIIEKKEQEGEKKAQQTKEIEGQVNTKAIVNMATSTRKRSYPKENIAFKCNYCDGGKEENGIGYIRACSDEMINRNIEIAHHRWCCNEEAPCRQYYDGDISRKELDNFSEDEGFVCYESQMLKNWTAFAGFILTEENKQKPMKLNKVQINSLAILTTRKINDKEADRFVFAVFLVDEAYEGDNRDEGYVTTSSKYKLSLTEEESRNILFWNYYCNEKAPEKPMWRQGLHRYISDIQAASILRDIFEVKRGTKDEELAQEFFAHFCIINGIDAEDMPIREGALQRN